MDAINFVNYLRNPGHLHQVTFQELNNLIEQYPYCQNLHYLALRKAHNENHKDLDKKLELAATYCPNRRWLFNQIKINAGPQAMTDQPKTKEELETTHTDPISAPDYEEVEEAPQPQKETPPHRRNKLPGGVNRRFSGTC